MKATPTEILWHELKKRGVKREDFTVEGSSFLRFSFPDGGEWFRSGAAPSYPGVSRAAQEICRNKHVASEVARQLNIATPAEAINRNDDSAAEAFLREHRTIVVKPLNNMASNGVTLNVSTSESLQKALTAARAFSSDVLLQKMVYGSEVRVTVVDGEAVSVIERRTARVVGDGVRTVAELIDEENAARESFTFPHLVYPKLEGELIDASVDVAAIPEKDEIVLLNNNSMVGRGASLYERFYETHDDYKRMAERFAAKIQAPFFVFDMMIHDISASAHADNYAFIEANTSPSLRMYSAIRGGNTIDIIAKIADYIERAHAMSHAKTLGCFEFVNVSEFGISNAMAKIDSGAFSGAIHCTNIKVVRRGKDKRRVLKFTPLGNDALATETEDFMETYVRSATGHRVERYVVRTTVEIGGIVYPITVGVSDRSQMRMPILLGRRFLREHNLIVDVRVNEQYDDEGENTK